MRIQLQGKVRLMTWLLCLRSFIKFYQRFRRTLHPCLHLRQVRLDRRGSRLRWPYVPFHYDHDYRVTDINVAVHKLCYGMQEVR